MTKRPCPFDFNFCRQLKIHVNNYENDINILKDIQDKTLRKLIEGSKKVYSSNLISDDYTSEISQNVAFNVQKHYKQKCVTNYFTINGKLRNENNNPSLHFSNAITKCFFCEIEANPIYQCVYCLQFYCPSCSFVNYGSFEDSRICISCS